MDNAEHISGADLRQSLQDDDDGPYFEREVDIEALIGNGTPQEIDTAIDICQCIEEFEENESIKATDNLVTFLLNSLLIQNNEVLERMIRLSRELYEDQAVASDRILRCRRADNYAKALGNRYWQRGSSEDLLRATELSEEAVAASSQATSILGSPLGTILQQPSYEVHTLNNLAARLGERFQLTGSLDCLNRSIDILERLLSAVHGPKWDADRTNWSSNLASYLQRRYEQSDGMSTVDIDRSITILRETLETTGEHDLARPGLLLDLGNAIAGRAVFTRHVHELDEAIALLHKAQNIKPTTDTRNIEVQYNLALRLFQRHAVGDIDEAIILAESTLGRVAEEHPVWPHLHNLLGALRYEQYVEDPSMERAERVLELSKKALGSSHYPSVLYRVQAGRRLLQLYCQLENWQGAYEVAVTAIELIPKLSMREIRNSDRQRMLSADDVVGFSSDAAAAALNAGKSGYEVIKLLEMGRGSLASSVAELRTDLTSLRQEYPVEAERFIQLRDQLGADSHGQASASRDFDTLLDDIRQKPGFEGFLKPPTYQTILDAAAEGPIIMLNQSKHRRGIDAITIDREGIHIINLDYKMENVDVSPGNLQHPTFLAMLWDSVAKPVLESLSIESPCPGKTLPRIWWVPTGPLGRLPFHAAGRHFAAVRDSVMDLVVSSYSSSIKALLEARKRPSMPPQPGQGRAFLVGMSITPDCTDLPFAIEEVRNIKRIFEDRAFRCSLLHNSTALKQNVLQHLKACDMFHFAGHAMEDASDPLRGTLLLHDKGTTPMTVEDLLEVNLSEESPYLAFLAACKTGSVTATQFQDESIHLVAAYQLAGFRHVIGSLWSVEDQVSMSIAEGTYMELLPEMTEDRVSRSLHAATRNLRDQARALQGVENDITSRDIVLVEDDWMSLGREGGNWVPFVHFGI